MVLSFLPALCRRHKSLAKSPEKKQKSAVKEGNKWIHHCLYKRQRLRISEGWVMQLIKDKVTAVGSNVPFSNDNPVRTLIFEAVKMAQKLFFFLIAHKYTNKVINHIFFFNIINPRTSSPNLNPKHVSGNIS